MEITAASGISVSTWSPSRTWSRGGSSVIWKLGWMLWILSIGGKGVVDPEVPGILREFGSAILPTFFAQ